MTIKKNLNFSTDGVSIYAVEFELTDEIKKQIEKAREILNVSENSFIDSVTFSQWLNMKQFDSTLDDKEIKELKREDVFYFRYDYVIFQVSKYGQHMKVYNKWDSGEYFDVEFTLDNE